MGVVNSFSVCVRECDCLLIRGRRPWRSSRELNILHYFHKHLLGLRGLTSWASSYNNPYLSKRGARRLFYLPFQLLILMLSSKKISQLFLPDEIFNLLLQVIALFHVMLWSLWKRQYLFLLRLLRSPFIFSCHFREGLSLICIRTYLSGMFSGMYCWLRAEGPTFLPSQSFLSSVRPFFGRGTCSKWRMRFAPILSALFLFLAMIASSVFIKFWAKWTSSAVDWDSS